MNPRPAHVGFVVGKVVSGQLFYRVPFFPLVTTIRQILNMILSANDATL
jgi:hypothetical protein